MLTAHHCIIIVSALKSYLTGKQLVSRTSDVDSSEGNLIIKASRWGSIQFIHSVDKLVQKAFY
jgi:hypothetical protein